MRHIASLGAQPAAGQLDGVEALCRSLVEGPPEEGSELSALLDVVFDTCLPASFNAPGPGYLAFIPGGGLFASVLADFVANGVNRYTGVWNASPALVQLEANVLDWFRAWMGFPKGTRGLLTTGDRWRRFRRWWRLGIATWGSAFVTVCSTPRRRLTTAW